jgi:septal ring-binding cell division protein DamX
MLSVMLGALTACSSNKPPPKIAPNGEYMGWHCGIDPTAESHWRCDRKAFIDGAIVTAETAVESALEGTQSPSSASSVPPAVKTVKVAELQVQVETEPKFTAEPVFKPEAETTASISGYGLQLGAYASREKAEQVAQSMILDEDIQVRAIMSNGRALWVIVLGPYQTRVDAEVAAKPLITNYWIRSMRSLADAAVK